MSNREQLIQELEKKHVVEDLMKWEMDLYDSHGDEERQEIFEKVMEYGEVDYRGTWENWTEEEKRSNYVGLMEKVYEGKEIEDLKQDCEICFVL